MRILHIDSERSWRGGENQVLLLSLYQLRQGHRVAVTCPPRSELAKRAAEKGVTVELVPMRGESDFVAGYRLGCLVKQGGYEIVHCHSAHAHSLGVIASKLARIPVLVVSRRVDFHVGGKSWFGHYKYSSPDKFIAVSGRVKQILIEGGIPDEKIVVIHSGIDLQRFEGIDSSADLRREFRLKREEKVVGIVAALAPHKDHPNFLRAARIVTQRLPRAKFLIAGEGKEATKLKNLTAQLALGNSVIFTGFRKDVPRLLSLFDVFVVSSYMEGLCTSILDAMAAGVPVVATDTGGIPELVKNEQNGILVPPRDPEGLAKGILRLLSDSGLTQRLGEAGRVTARQFSAERMAEKTGEVYQSVLKEKRGQP